ncbi:MAG: hypothetical protein WBW69_17970 [Candidatus Korobacteraceae bacterium]
MLVGAIGSSAVSQLANIQRSYQQVRGEFQNLGQDLQAGNLAQAQTDFVTLSASVSTQYGANSAVSKTLNAIGQALQSGDLSTAQQAYSTLPPGLTGQSGTGHAGRHGTMHPCLQGLDQLGQALQSGDLTGAQQAFAALQQNWQQVVPNSVLAASPSNGTGSSGFSVTV